MSSYFPRSKGLFKREKCVLTNVYFLYMQVLQYMLMNMYVYLMNDKCVAFFWGGGWVGEEGPSYVSGISDVGPHFAGYNTIFISKDKIYL